MAPIGVQDSFIVCCDGLKGLPDSIRATWPLADVQLCVVHRARSSLRYSSKQHWGHVYLVATQKRPNRSNPTGRINAWKPILNALTSHYGDRIQPPPDQHRHVR
jgi:transposase-like protein